MIVDLHWDRTKQASTLRDQLWRYVSPAATQAYDVLPLASALLQLRRTDRDYLTALHLLLSPQAHRLVDAAPQLLRQLTTSTAVVIDEHPERIRGPVDWPSTLAMRGVRGSSLGYSTRPTERVLSTPENRLLVAALNAVREAHQQLGWEPTASATVGEKINHIGLRTARILSSPVLRSISDPLEVRDLSRTVRGRAARRFLQVTDFWQLHRALADLEDVNLLRQLVESTALHPATDGAMLELISLFRTLETLRGTGWESRGMSLIGGKVRVRHTKKDGSTLTVHFQDTPRELARHDDYSRILTEHGVASGPLRPDLVLDHRPASGRRSLGVVEIKYRRRAADAARAAALNMMAYRDAYRSYSECPVTFVGLVWGAGLTSVPSRSAWLCSLDQWPTALGRLIDVEASDVSGGQ